MDHGSVAVSSTVAVPAKAGFVELVLLSCGIKVNPRTLQVLTCVLHVVFDDLMTMKKGSWSVYHIGVKAAYVAPIVLFIWSLGQAVE